MQGSGDVVGLEGLVGGVGGAFGQAVIELAGEEFNELWFLQEQFGGDFIFLIKANQFGQLERG